jgi:hypothetical protein
LRPGGGGGRRPGIYATDVRIGRRQQRMNLLERLSLRRCIRNQGVTMLCERLRLSRTRLWKFFFVFWNVTPSSLVQILPEDIQHIGKFL